MSLNVDIGLGTYDFSKWGYIDVHKIKEVHIYDFDNVRLNPWKDRMSVKTNSFLQTLFQTPLPNANIWSNQAIRILMAFNSMLMVSL